MKAKIKRILKNRLVILRRKYKVANSDNEIKYIENQIFRNVKKLVHIEEDERLNAKNTVEKTREELKLFNYRY